MKISGTGPVQTTPVRRREKAGPSSASGFASELQGDAAVGTANATTGAAALNALLSVQEVDDPAEERRRAVVRGDDILDQLDELRHGLLIGAFPKEKLQRLLALVRRQHVGVVDAGLREVLEEIELRAEVELAKLGRVL